MAVLDLNPPRRTPMLGLKLLLPAAVAAACGVLMVLPVAAGGGADATEKARRFVAGHEDKVRPLEVAAGLAWWNANVTGLDEDFKKKEDAQNRLDEALADRARFAELKGLKEAGKNKEIA